MGKVVFAQLGSAGHSRSIGHRHPRSERPDFRLRKSGRYFLFVLTCTPRCWMINYCITITTCRQNWEFSVRCNTRVMKTSSTSSTAIRNVSYESANVCSLSQKQELSHLARLVQPFNQHHFLKSAFPDSYLVTLVVQPYFNLLQYLMKVEVKLQLSLKLG